MKYNYKIGVWVLIILLIGFLVYYSINRPEKELTPEEKDNLAKCLTQKGFALHGSINCPDCVVQKDMFNESIKYLTYINCDLHSNDCLSGVSLPYWNIYNNIIEGPVPLNILKKIAKC